MSVNLPRPEAIPGIRKAAILLVMLGEDVSAELLRQLEEQEVQAIGREVARLSAVTAEQAEGVVEGTGLELGLRGGQGTPRANYELRRERGGPFQEGGRGGETAPRLGSSRRTLELSGDLGIGPGRGLGAMPSAPVGVDLGVGGRRQSLVGLGPLDGSGRPVHGRAHQGMPERHPASSARNPSDSAVRAAGSGNPSWRAARTDPVEALRHE